MGSSGPTTASGRSLLSDFEIADIDCFVDQDRKRQMIAAIEVEAAAAERAVLRSRQESEHGHVWGKYGDESWWCGVCGIPKTVVGHVVPLVVNFGPDVTPEVAEAASEQIAVMVEAQRAEIIEQEHARLWPVAKVLFDHMDRVDEGIPFEDEAAALRAMLEP